MKSFSGIHAVLYALFDENGKLDQSAMRSQVQLMLCEGVNGITVLGLATEVSKLTPSEQRDVIKWTAEEISNRVPLSVTVTGNDVDTQRELSSFSIDHGADWLILQPPTVGSFSGDVYLDFFKDVAKGFTAPFAIQNAPQYLGRSLSSTDIEKLTDECPHFSLIKAEVSAIELADLIKTIGKKLIILNGRGALELTDCLRAGVDGLVLAPDVIDFSKRVFDLWQKGECQLAEEQYQRVLPVIVFIMQSIEHLICYGKRIYGLRSGTPIYDRSPALTPTEFGLESVRYWSKYLGSFSSVSYEK
tara:strand:- start:1639 stop:2544 length:906 start_codon:yes stop_codon:yes gene_type:complete